MFFSGRYDNTMATETIILAIASVYLGWKLRDIGWSQEDKSSLRQSKSPNTGGSMWQTCPPCPPCQSCPSVSTQDIIMARDRAVLTDQLYPPYNRPNRSFGLPDPRVLALNRGYDAYADTFRLVGYVFGEQNNQSDGGGNAWKLFARATGRGSRAEFYISPAYAGIDVKIVLDDNTVVNANEVRDLDNLPRFIQFKHPMLYRHPYTVTELPRADLVQSGPYF